MSMDSSNAEPLALVQGEIKDLIQGYGLTLEKLASKRHLLGLRAVRRRARSYKDHSSLVVAARAVLLCALSELGPLGKQHADVCRTLLNLDGTLSKLGERRTELMIRNDYLTEDTFRALEARAIETYAAALIDLDFSPCSAEGQLTRAIETLRAEQRQTNDAAAEALIRSAAAHLRASRTKEETIEELHRLVELLPNTFNAARNFMATYRSASVKFRNGLDYSDESVENVYLVLTKRLLATVWQAWVDSAVTERVGPISGEAAKWALRPRTVRNPLNVRVRHLQRSASVDPKRSGETTDEWFERVSDPTVALFAKVLFSLEVEDSWADVFRAPDRQY